jgi:hypothetical protein
MNFQDRGHYYLNGVLVPDMTMSKCRDEGGVASVTTKIANWNDQNLMFWHIEENVEAAYSVMGANLDTHVTLEEYRKLVADEYYRTHNHLKIGTLVDQFITAAIDQTIALPLFYDFFMTTRAPEISSMYESIRSAYEWYLENVTQGKAQVKVYDKKNMIAGTADVSGMIKDQEGKTIPGGVDFKTKYIKTHPGYKKDGGPKSIPVKRDIKHKLQLGAYGKALGWEGAYALTISTNPLVPGVIPHWYSLDELKEGYTIFAHIGRAYDLQNGFIK